MDVGEVGRTRISEISIYKISEKLASIVRINLLRTLGINQSLAEIWGVLIQEKHLEFLSFNSLLQYESSSHC